jgi:hypothetical protein
VERTKGSPRREGVLDDRPVDIVHPRAYSVKGVGLVDNNNDKGRELPRRKGLGENA